MRKHLSHLVSLKLARNSLARNITKGLTTILLGLQIVGCATSSKMELRLPDSWPDYSKVVFQERDYFEFKSRREAQEALVFWKAGEVKKGEWQGLKLRTYNLDEKTFLEEVAQNPSPSVKKFIEDLKREYPLFDELHPIKRAQLIYDIMRISFRYRANPFDKLKIGKLKLDNSRLDAEMLKIKTTRVQPYQEVEETFNFKGGICINLSTLLYSMYNYAGVNCTLILQDNHTGNDHILVAFEAFPNKFTPIDPTQYQLGFVENIATSQKNMGGSLVKQLVPLDLKIKKELLNLTDYL